MMLLNICCLNQSYIVELVNGHLHDEIFPNVHAFQGNEGESVADFIVDHAIVKAPQNYLELEPWRLYFEGSSHPNRIGIRVLIISYKRIPTNLKYKIDRFCSNNETEYEALIAGLEILLDLGERRVKIRGDSELVVKHVTKEYRCIK